MLKKLTILILSIFLVLCAGSCNVYPIYLEKLMNRFNYSLTEVNLFGTAVNMGLWIAFPMGFIYDKFGPRISCILSLIILTFCYGFLNLIMNDDAYLGISIYPLLGVAFLMGQGSALLYTSSLTTNLKNFRFKGNTVLIALLIANMAVSPSVFTTYRQNMKLTYENFFLIICILLVSVILVSLIFLENIEKPYPSDEKLKHYQKFKENKILRIMLGFNIVVVGIYIFSILFNFFKDKNLIPIIVIYPFMLFLNFTILILEKLKIFDSYFYNSYIHSKPKELKELVSIESEKNIKKEISQIDIPNDSNLESIADSFQNRKNYISDGRNSLNISVVFKIKDYSPVQAIKTKKFILLFFILIFGVGSAIANLNNLQFILKSTQGYKKPFDPLNRQSNIIAYFDKRLFIYLILYFIFNSSTRLISGYVLDFLIKRNKFYNYILFFSGIGFISQVLGIFMDKNLLYVSISLAGATHGGYFTFVPTFVKREFGLKNMGKNYGLMTMGAALGSLLISDYIFIYSYDSFSKTHVGNCRGKGCFYPSYIMTSVFFIINIILSYVLVKNNNNVKKV